MSPSQLKPTALPGSGMFMADDTVPTSRHCWWRKPVPLTESLLSVQGYLLPCIAFYLCGIEVAQRAKFWARSQRSGCTAGLIFITMIVGLLEVDEAAAIDISDAQHLKKRLRR